MYSKLNKTDLIVQTCYKKNMPKLAELKKMTRKQIIELLEGIDLRMRCPECKKVLTNEEDCYGHDCEA